MITKEGMKKAAINILFALLLAFMILGVFGSIFYFFGIFVTLISVLVTLLLVLFFSLSILLS